MDDVQPRPLTAVLREYRPAPASRGRLLLLGVLTGVLGLLAVLHAVDGSTWQAGFYGLMTAMWVFQVRLERHPPVTTVIASAGLRVRRWTSRWRDISWERIDRVSLVRDAQGFSAARLVDGAKVRLVGVPHDVVQVLAEHVHAVRARA